MRRILDTDQHVTPPKNFWVDRMPAKFADVAPRVVETDDGTEAWSFDGGKDLHAFGLENVGGENPSRLSWHMRYDQMDPAFYDPKARLAAMDVDGVDVALLFASVAGRCAATEDDELYEQCFVTYNDGILDWAGEGDPDRMFPAAIIPCRSLEMSMKELGRVADLGFRHFLGIMSPNGSPHPSPEDRPFWALVQETGLVVSLHGGGVGGRFPAQAAREGNKRLAVPPVRDQVTIAAGRSGAMGVTTTLANFVLYGLFEQFPYLKFALIETSVGWFRSFAERLDAAFLAHRSLLEDPSALRQLPSEYLSRVRMNFDRETDVNALIADVGVDRLLFGTDYPHIGTYWPHSRYYLELLFKQLSSADIDAILWDNAAELYRIEVPKAARAAA